ncbi:MAG: ATP-binding protein [Planctomycetota bacterium]|jgi:magnesium chelatase family protein
MTTTTITTARQARQLMRELRDEPQHTLLLGSHGAGKVMVARRIAAAQPLLSGDDLAKAAWLRFGGRLAPAEHAWSPLPCLRAPHYTASLVAMLGNPDRAWIGELALAHGGTLLLDEVTEWRQAVLGAALGAVQDGGACLLPPDWLTGRQPPRALPRLVIGTSVCCPCGWFGSAQRRCACADWRRERWQAETPQRLRLDFWQRVVQVHMPLSELALLPELAQGPGGEALEAA